MKQWGNLWTFLRMGKCVKTDRNATPQIAVVVFDLPTVVSQRELKKYNLKGTEHLKQKYSTIAFAQTGIIITLYLFQRNIFSKKTTIMELF